MDAELVIIFAKAPEPGQVKTRLIPTLGAESAAMLHAALVERALETATRSDAHDVALCCAPDASATFFEECAEDFDITLAEQGDGDLGARMLRAMMAALDDYDKVVIVGADCPSVTSKDIRAAFAALDSHDVAIFPADDGGYVLIGARRIQAAMFDAIAWGTDDVLAQQLKQLDACSLTTWQGETRWDVDRSEDLARLATLKPPLAFFR
jgi:rSAM/selenodomain-associated transferase 1